MGKKEKLFILWAVSALFLVIIISTFFGTSFPMFTIIWISVPLIAVIRKKDASITGFRQVPINELIKFTLINLGLTLLIYGIFEPWSHTYQELLKIITGSRTPDVTFIWLTKYSGTKAWLSMLLFSGFVTLFGEEIFFRGWLLQYLKKRINTNWAIIIQSAIFIIPNTLVAFFMIPLQGVLYTVIYTGVAIGIVGGWTAKRTNSIWPSLISASIVNLLAVLLLN
ncbi:MAG: CPBP family intramembrane metalloprotease [Bacillota bacterium]|nr:CPBP family intramembrane metalloprotease [Bacillota bacterium]